MSRRCFTILVTILLAATQGVGSASREVAAATRITLADAVALALGQYPGIGLARAKSDEAHAAIREAFAAWLPTLQLGATAMWYEKPMLVFPLHGLDPLSLVTPGQGPQFDRALVQGALTLDYTLFDAGRNAKVRRARYQAAAADAGLNASQQAVALRVINAYLGVLAKRETLAAHDRRLESLESELSRAHKLRDVGRAADVEVLRVEAALSTAQADRVHLFTELDTAERELARLIDIPYEQIQTDELSWVAQADTTVMARDSALAMARGSSPNLTQASRQADAAQAGRTAARGTMWPVLRATSAYVDRGASPGVYKAEWNAGLVLAYPLFTGGAVRSAIARADAAAIGAQEQLRLAQLQLAEDIDRALGAVRESRARVRSLDDAVSRFTEVVRIEKLSLETGARTQTDYLRAEADLLSARAGLAEARRGEIAARAELARVTGQLSSHWIANSLENRE